MTPSISQATSGYDLEWDDRDLFPDVIYPDVDFLLQRTNEVTLEIIDARPGELILDIGCGRAMDGVNMAKTGAQVIGLEPSPQMLKHAKKYISENGASMSLIRGIGEGLPFGGRSIDKVVCKGALDHFPKPHEVIAQMAEVLKPEGKAIIAIANFDSLGFRIAKLIWRIRKAFGIKAPDARMPWELPEDHTFEFNYKVLKDITRERLEVESVSGVSLLFGTPWWGLFLAKLPRNISLATLRSLDNLARHLPWLSDVVVLKCRPRI